MAELSQFNESNPALNVQQVSSKASGYEAFAKTLGDIAGAASDKAVEIETDQSNAMYIHSVSNMEQLKTSAQMAMLEHPDQAPKIAENLQNSITQVQEAAYVNRKDRVKLDAYGTATADSVALEATRASVHQGQLMAAYTHYANWPDQLAAYQAALSKNDGTADNLKDAMMKSLKSLVSIGAITPEQAGSSIKSMAGVVDIARDNIAMYNSGTATPQDYHTVNSPLLNKNPASNVNTPINEETGWAVNYATQDKTFQGVLADLYNHQLPSPQFFDSLKPAERQRAILTMQGVMQSDGLINSGTPYPVLKQQYDSLSAKGEVLSYRDQALRNSLGVYLNKLKSGDYLGAIQGTPGGGAILHDYVARNAAIDNAAVSDQDKGKFKLDNLNNMVDRAAAYGEGHHMPNEVIQPIPAPIVADVENGFKQGSDPTVVLSTLGQFNKQNQTYLANAMKNPDQRLIVQSLAFSGNNIKPSDKLDFIAANQEGREFVNKELTGGVKDKDIANRVYANLSNQLKLIGQNYDYQQAQALQNSMINTTVKYAKYLAQKDNNLTMESKWSDTIGAATWKKYVDKASEIYATSFQQMSGTNYSINPNQLPIPVTKGELDVLADYAINQGYDYLRQGRKSFEYESAIGRNPLKMVLSPTNQIQAVDANGKVYYSTPFTANLLSHAQEDAKKRLEEKRKAIIADIERSERRRLNVRLPEDASSQ